MQITQTGPDWQQNCNQTPYLDNKLVAVKAECLHLFPDVVSKLLCLLRTDGSVSATSEGVLFHDESLPQGNYSSTCAALTGSYRWPAIFSCRALSMTACTLCLRKMSFCGNADSRLNGPEALNTSDGLCTEFGRPRPCSSATPLRNQ